MVVSGQTSEVRMRNYGRPPPPPYTCSTSRFFGKMAHLVAPCSLSILLSVGFARPRRAVVVLLMLLELNRVD